MKQKSNKTPLTKAILIRLFQEKYSRLKRPILHYLFRESNEFNELNNISQAAARKLICDFLQTKIGKIQYHLMQKPMKKSALNQFDFTIEAGVIEELNNQLNK